MRRIRRHKPQWGGAKLLLFTVALGAFIQWLYTEPPKPLSPLAETTHAQSLIPSDKAVGDAESHTPAAVAGNTDKQENTGNPGNTEPDDIQKTDKWVGQYVDKYFTSHYGRSRIRGVMHCLLTKESQHTFMTASDHHGDNGMAGGILQYWPYTWTGFRKIMMDRGLVTEIGSRYNPEQAIETTVWALSDGRERNWGPINVGDCLHTQGAK